MPANAPGTNRILARLSTDDRSLLARHLEAIDLPVPRYLERRGKPIEFVVFPDSGFASVVADGANTPSVEVGLIGREGMTGLAVIMGVDRSPHDTFMQSRGAGQRIAVSKFENALRHSPTLHAMCLKWAHTFLIQSGQTALINARHNIEERLARWLLMARDRCDSDQLDLTHDFLATMLGVRRAGVSVALQKLKKRGFIEPRRSGVFVIDQKGLIETAKGAYGVSEAEYARLFG